METTWIISDSASSFSTSDFSISGESLGKSDAAYCRKTTLTAGRQAGVEIVEISNGFISLRVCPTRGMGIIDGKAGHHFLGWNSPVKEIVHPQYINLYDLGGRGCHYGFNEMLNRCGIEWSGAMGSDALIDNKGQKSKVFLPLHGKVGWTPASRVVLRIDDEGQMTLEGEIPEQNVFGVNYILKTRLTLPSDSASFSIEDTLCNLGSEQGEYEMLYHTNFGKPFLEEGSRYYGSYSRLVPRDEFGTTDPEKIAVLQGPSAGFIEQVYLCKALADEEGNAHQLLTNASQDLAVHVTFDSSTLPYSILWKRTASETDGYVAGLNPCTDLPNNRAIERSQGRVSTILPHSEITFRHAVEIVEGNNRITGLIKTMKELSSWAEIGLPGDFEFLMNG